MMGIIQAGSRTWFFWIVTGLALMDVALFLHPMSPESFLELAFSDPMQSIFELQGGGVAIFFWTSMAFALIGLFGLLISNFSPRRLLPRSQSGLHALP
jgi:hypothetical protein